MLIFLCAFPAKNSDKMETYDCFACAVLTHGTTNKENGEQQLVFADGLLDLSELTVLVNNDNCVTLCGKPKIFIIQVIVRLPILLVVILRY